ncbi:MAG: tetratricopeptide repeat protein, partial [Planctomycetes bacterium]|nr:tetratricopeptide repeat protein [Planctomycetota bacterium]
MPTTADKLAAALILYQEKNLAGAEQLCQGVLKQEPRNADALYLLCLVTRKTDRVDLSLELIRRALDERPQDAVFH